MRRSTRFVSRLSMGVLLAVAGLAPGTAALGQESEPTPPKYVFLMIGDGMGFPQVDLAERAHRAETGEALRMTRLPVQGQARTAAANHRVTDSAAAATALAAGIRTNNGMVGQAPNGQPVGSIAADFLRAGRGVGVLSSVQVNHATPACFYAHVEHRNQYSEIADQFDASGVHLLVGRDLNSQDKRKDEILSTWRASGIAVVESIEEAASIPREQRLVVLAKSLIDTGSEEGQLADAVELAINRLGSDEGFFMMVEGGAIDWRGHANEGWELIRETRAFDRAIDRAYRFYEEHPEQTLIVVTADHETGGLSLADDRLDLDRLREVPDQLAALGKALPTEGEEITVEVAEQLLREFMGIDEWTEEELAAVTEVVGKEAKGRRSGLARLAKRMAESRAGVVWSTTGHTAADVPVMAVGVGAERFAGTIDNIDIPRGIRELCLPGVPHPQVSDDTETGSGGTGSGGTGDERAGETTPAEPAAAMP